MGEVILTMKGIDKSFPGVHALDHVDLEIRKGEVLALMGENGAGKSTLMKVLTGIYKKDSGTITYEGKEVEFANPRDAQAAGVVIVHQELNMMNHLTVAQNIFIGREIMNGKLINDAKMNQEAAKLFDRLNIKIDPTEKMGNLTVGRQQMCEIYLHQIFAGRRKPSRNRLLCLCFGLEASVEETQELLKLCGMAQLYPKLKRDAIIYYGLLHGLKLFEINDKLFDDKYS